METTNKTRTLVTTALVGAVYVVLTLAFAPLSFGPVQIRFSEAFTILAVYSPAGGVAITFACFLSNAVGFFTGANPLGVLDVFFGTLATGLAALASYALRSIRWKGLPVLSTLPPVLFNAVILGAEFTYLTYSPAGSFPVGGVFAFHALSVALGQLISCVVLGLALFAILEKTKLDEKYLIPEKSSALRSSKK